MRYAYTLILLTLLAACSGRKPIYDDKNITDKKLEKLVADFSGSPRDTALARQVIFAYQTLEAERLAQVNRYRYSSTLADKERSYMAWQNLQDFYDNSRRYGPVADLVKPGQVGAEIAQAKLDMVSGYYTAAEGLINENNWRTSREAYGYLQKVEKWMPNYKDNRSLTKVALEQGTITAVILPLTAQGFYYPQNNFGGFNSGRNLPDQLVRDLGGRYGSNSWYQVYSQYDYNNRQSSPDWTISPIWTYLNMDRPQVRRSTENRTKQIEISRDTANRPVYKTVRATITIFESVQAVNGALELRIEDASNRQQISSSNFRDDFRLAYRWASYTGDAAALSNYDWELINAQRQQQQMDEGRMEERLLEKLYPQMLSYLRGRLGN